MSDNPILDELFDQAPEGMWKDAEPVNDKPYGLGTHPKAKLAEVITFAKGDYGFRLGLKFFLNGEEEKLPYTARIDLPRTLTANGHDVQDWQLKKEADKLALVNELLVRFGSSRQLGEGITIDTEAQYDSLANIFRQLEGNIGKVRIVQDGKNVKQEDSTWKFVANQYTKLATAASRK